MYNIPKQSGIYSQNAIKVKKRHGSSSNSIDTKVGGANTRQTSNVLDKLKESFLRFYMMLPAYHNKPLKQLYTKP